MVNVGLARASPRTGSPQPTACMLATACMQHTHITSHSHRSHTTPERCSTREGPRAGTLHGRGTALAPRREGLARHHQRHSPSGGLLTKTHWHWKNALLKAGEAQKGSQERQQPDSKGGTPRQDEGTRHSPPRVHTYARPSHKPTPQATATDTRKTTHGALSIHVSL